MVKRAETGMDNRHNFLAVVVVDSHSTGRYLLKVILGGKDISARSSSLQIMEYRPSHITIMIDAVCTQTITKCPL